MGEIKSTLDLVMEKTKHLSLSAEEKVGQQREAYEKRLKGFLQQYADGLLTIVDFQDQLLTIQKNLGVNDIQPLIRQILNHVNPDRDNSLWLDLLETYRPRLKAPTQEILSTYVQHRENLLQTGMQNYLERLRSDHQIYGPAVVPNLIQDQKIQQELMIMKNKVRDNLNTLSDQSASSGQPYL